MHHNISSFPFVLLGSAYLISGVAPVSWDCTACWFPADVKGRVADKLSRECCRNRLNFDFVFLIVSVVVPFVAVDIPRYCSVSVHHPHLRRELVFLFSMYGRGI